VKFFPQNTGSVVPSLASRSHGRVLGQSLREVWRGWQDKRLSGAETRGDSGQRVVGAASPAGERRRQQGGQGKPFPQLSGK